MANTRFQLKRSSVSGVTPTTGDIATGELGVNLADRKLFTSNGTTVFELGSNLASLAVGNTTARQTVNSTGVFVNGGISLTRNDTRLAFAPTAGGSNVYFAQQSDDNFVFYTTNTSGAVRPVFSVFANTNPSNQNSAFTFRGPVDFATVGVYANNSLGSSGQVLTSNGSGVYWSTVSGGGGGGSVNTAAQFTWTNTHTFTANVSFTGSGIGITSNTGAIYLGGIADANWRIGRSTGAFTKWSYTNNTIDAVVASSPDEGFAIGVVSGNSVFETGYKGTFIAANVTIGNSTVATTINATAFSGTANNANNLGGTSLSTIQGQITGNAATAYTNATSYADLRAANAYSNAVANAAALYQTTAGLSANVATLTANAAGFLGNSSGTLANIASWATANAATAYANATAYADARAANAYSNAVANAAALYQTTAGLSANVATLTANAAGFLGNSSGTLANVSSWVTTNAAAAYSNAISYADLRAANAYSNAVANAAALYQTTAGLSANVATLTANAAGFLGNSSGTLANVSSWVTSNAASAYSNAVANAAALYQTTAGLSANVATLTANAAGFLGNSSGTLANVASWVTGNAATAYANATSYVDGKSFVNSSQLSSNLNNYAALAGATFSGAVVIANNLTVSGNLTLQGNTVIVGASDLIVNDAVISLHSPANGAPLTTNDGRNIGIAFHYYDTQDRHAALLRDNATGYLAWYTTASDPNTGNNVVGNTLGVIQASSFIAGNSTVNATVNSTAFSGTANNATNFDGLSLATVQGQITGNAATAYTNATNFAANATNISTGTLTNARLPAAINVASVSVANLTLVSSGSNGATLSGNGSSGGLWLIANTFSLPGVTGPRDIFFRPNGLTAYVIENVGDTVIEYPLSSAWNISTMGAAVANVAIGETAPEGVFFRDDGTRMFVIGSSGDAVREFALSTAWSVNTATFTTSFSVATQDTAPSSLAFSNTGSKLFVLGGTNDTVFEYDLSTPWSVNTAVYNSQSLSVATQDTQPFGLGFNSTGTRMVITGIARDAIYFYRLTTPWSVNTAIFEDSRSLGTESRIGLGVFVEESQNKAWIVDDSNDRIIEYNTNAVGLHVNSAINHFKGITSFAGNVGIVDTLHVGNSITVENDLTVLDDLTVAGDINFTTVTGSVNLGTTGTTATVTVGGNNQTGTIQIGRSTANQTLSIANGATASGSTKIVNIGTNGAAGSNTTINIGSSAGSGQITVNQQSQFVANVQVGNSTVNAQLSNAVIAISNATSTTTLGLSDLRIGNTATNVVISNTISTFGGNVSITGSANVANVTAAVFTGNLTGTASNTTNLNSQPGSFYTNASNITTGTLPDARLSSAVVNTSGNFTVAGNINFTAANVNFANVHIGANVDLTTTTLLIGNTSVNTAVTAGQVSLSGVTVNSTIYQGTANNANNLGGNPSSFYTNASNITTGTLPNAQLGANVTNTSANFTITGIRTHQANIVVGNTTVNTQHSNATILISNSTSTTTLGLADLRIGNTATNVIIANTTSTFGGNVVVTGTMNASTVGIGAIPIVSQGANGFSVNENFNVGNNSITGYHFTSGSGRTSAVFTLARSGSFTSGFGITGDASNNQFVIASEFANAGFVFKRSVGMPFNVAGGTALLTIANTGLVTLTGNLHAGNTTVNTQVSNATILISNSTSTTTLGLADIRIGNTATNVVIANTTSTFGGNVVITGTANVSANLVVGASGELIISNGAGIQANGTFGTTGQVLTSNGTGVYWAAAAAGVNTAAQFSWTNTHVFSSNVTVNAASLFVSNSDTITTIDVSGIYVGNTTTNVVIANTTSAFGGNVVIVGTANVGGNVAIAGSSSLRIGNATVNSALTHNVLSFDGTTVLTATDYTGTANNSYNLGGLFATNYQLTANLSNAVATFTSNNATNFNGQPASFYTNATNITSGTLPNDRLSAQVVNTSANFTIAGIHTHTANVHMGNTTVNTQQSNAIIVINNSNTATLNASSISFGNTTVNAVYGLATIAINGAGIANSTGANNAFNLGGVAAASYVNTTGTYTLTGIRTYQSNVVVGNTTVNTQHSNATILISNSTSTTTLGLADLRIGNTTTNVVIANTTSTFGANVVITGTANAANINAVLFTGNVTGTASNATNLNSQPGSFYTNATNLTAGTLDNGRLSSAVVNTSGSFTLGGNFTYSANLTIAATGELIIANGAGIQANGSFGTSGHALFSNGTGVYWAAVAAGVNTAAQFAWTNTHSFAANLTITNTSELIIQAGAGIEANGSFGTAGQVLSSNGTSVYWASGVTADSTVTLTNKRIDPRVSTTASATTVTPDIGSFDMYIFTALAAGLTINATTGGSPVNGSKLMFRFRDNGTARALSWTTVGSNSFRAVGVTLPTTTVINKVTYVGCIYNATEAFWDVIAVLTQA